MLRIFRWLAILGVAAVLGFLGLFSIYGWMQGFHVGSGLVHLLAPTRAPVLTNPPMQNVAWQQVTWLGDIENASLNESSGLTASPQHQGVLWSINDSGSDPKVFAMDEQGNDLGEWFVDVDKAVDWESMDSFVLDGRSYLIIGDTGDNFRWRPYVWFLVVPEPTDLNDKETILDVAWRVEFTYPVGYRDSEALAVDMRQEQVYVLSKRHYPPELFRLPLQAAERTEAEFVQTLPQFPQYTEAEDEIDDDAYYRHMPSGMDIAGDRLLITTYQHAYLFSLADLKQAALRVLLPSVGQRETLSFAAGSETSAYVTKEREDGKGIADIFKVEFASESR